MRGKLGFFGESEREKAIFPIFAGMQLNFKSYGSGPALIILHGLFGSLDNWQTLARRYAEHFSVFAVDQRNHGKSPHSDDPFNYAQLAEDLHEFMEQQGIFQAHLLGHSMGGKTVMQFAAEYEHMIDRLVVADMGIGDNDRHHDLILDTLGSFPFDQIDARKDAEDWMEARISDFGVRMFLLKNLVRNPKGDTEFRWKFNFEVLLRDYENILAGVDAYAPLEVPTLFIRGGKSGYVRDEDLPEIKALFPNLQLETIEGAGHWLHAEAPEEFLDKTLAFLLAD